MGPFVIKSFCDGSFHDGSFCDGSFCDGSFCDGSLYRCTVNTKADLIYHGKIMYILPRKKNKSTEWIPTSVRHNIQIKTYILIYRTVAVYIMCVAHNIPLLPNRLREFLNQIFKFNLVQQQTFSHLHPFSGSLSVLR